MTNYSTECAFDVPLLTDAEREFMRARVIDASWYGDDDKSHDLWMEESDGEWDGPSFQAALIDAAGHFTSDVARAHAIRIHGDVDANQVTWFVSEFLSRFSRRDKIVADFAYRGSKDTELAAFGGYTVVIEAGRETWFNPHTLAKRYVADGDEDAATSVFDNRTGLDHLTDAVTVSSEP